MDIFKALHYYYPIQQMSRRIIRPVRISILLLFTLLSCTKTKLLAASDLFFSTLSMRDGLPSNIIAGITQDKYDFIWVGTGSGLARYDGNTFKIFKKSDATSSLPSNELNAVLAVDDFVWVGTWDGLCKVDIRSFKVTRINLGDERNTVRTLHHGKGNSLWVGTAGGLVKLNLENEEFEVFNQKSTGLSHNMVRSIYQGINDEVWVGTFDGLNRLDIDSKRFDRISLESPKSAGIDNHLVLDIKPDPADTTIIWVGTETGLFRVSTVLYSGTMAKSKEGFSNDVIKCLFADQTGQIWMGTDFGLNIYSTADHSNNTHFHNPQISYSIANNVIWQIFEDRGGVLWFVTSNGLSRSNPSGNFYTFHDISYSINGQVIGNQVKSFLVSSDGYYWMATQHGVIRMDPLDGSKKVFRKDSRNNERLILNNVYTLEEDSNGRIWIGTAGGINIWDPELRKMSAVKASEENGLNSNYIGNFSKAEDGSLWVSAWQGGLYRISMIEGQPKFDKVRGLESGSEKHVYGGGYVWSIEYDRLYQVDTSTLVAEHIEVFKRAAASNMIYTLFYSSAGHLWAGTTNGLIQYIPAQRRAVFHPIETGSEFVISGINEDANGNLWTTTNTSLLKYYPTERRFEVFPLDNNLPIKSFYYGCTSDTPDGQVVFGGDNGFIKFKPEKVSPNHYEPNIYITSLSLNNSPVSINQEIGGNILLPVDVAFVPELVLNYADRSMSVEFSSLHFWQPEMNIYNYRLSGLDEEWHNSSGRRNFAVYSNLPVGNYEFVVKGSNNYGVPSPQEAKLRITVKPPLFLSTGFVVLYVILVSIMIYYALKTYSARVKLKNQLEIARLEKAHAEELEHTKEKFFTNISHELRTPISLILPPIHEVQKKGRLDDFSRELIGLAEKNSIRLLRLVNQILDFNKIESETLQLKITPVELVGFCQEVAGLFMDQAKRHEIDFEFVHTVASQEVWVDGEKIETVLFNLLSNAFKFTPDGGSITFQVSLDENSEFKEGAFKIEVHDSGVGISPDEQSKIFERFYQTREGRRTASGSGIGLTLTAEYIELHHGLIEVNSKVGQGTTFTVELPLGKSHLPIDILETDGLVNLRATPSVHGTSKGSKYFQLGPASDKPMVLMIEDNPDMIDFVRNSLGNYYHFVTAEDGQEGLAKANNFAPKLIISDIMMPRMDGLELCKRIKQNPQTSHISIILLTAKSMVSNRIEGIKIGADAYITKPFEIELLKAHMDNLIQRQEELQAYFRNDLVQLPATSDASNNEDNKFVKRVMDIIEANISNAELSVEMIADEMAMSTTHLYRRLKATTDRSAKEIIQKYRLKKASLMLQNKEGNITEIMYRTGFSSLSYFSKCFKAEYGVPPKRYQERVV